MTIDNGQWTIKNEMKISNEAGQVVLILILVMTVALGIGVSVVQRSLSDVSTASKVEQSSRAFSAAEAGIEKAIQANGSPVPDFTLDSNSASVNTVPVPDTGQALEYPPLAKEEMAQVWLADPTSTSNPPAAVYTQNTLNVFWGNSSIDKAAIELTLVYFDTEYKSKKFYLDQITRTPDNNFDIVTTCAGSLGPASKYQCSKTINWSSLGTVTPMLIRARLLYNTTSQPFAVAPAGGSSLPAQGNIFTATGTSGVTQRKIQVFRLNKVVPSFFDYAIFSAGPITK